MTASASSELRPQTHLTLYVAGSRRASDLISKVSESARAFGDVVDLEVVDVLEDPGRAETDGILTTPMIVRWKPAPVRRVMGDVIDLARLLPSDEKVAPAPPPRQGPPPGPSAVISRAAHEVRTPLAVIAGFSRTLVETLARGDHEAALQCAEAINRGTTQLQTILNTMLVLDAVQRDGMRLDLTEFLLGDAVQETVRDLRVLASHHNVIVDAAEGVIVQADIGKVRQIVTNLLGNALKFSPRGSSITIEVKSIEDAGCISVEDDGPGIPEDGLERIFDQYERLDRPEKGMGLGLYISRRLAEAHGGSLAAMNRDEGGARFELVLPRYVDL